MQTEKVQVKQLFSFIENSPSAFHVIASMEAQLQKEGFSYLPEGVKWNIKEGGRYYTKRNDSSLIAWRMPFGKAKGYHIAAAHSDSPCFLIKENPEIQGAYYVRLNVEKYGGMILSTWLDRPLSVAGRIFVERDGKLETVPVDIQQDLFVIPNAAIHMHPQLNKGYTYTVGKDMLPLYTGKEGKKFLARIAEETGVAEKAILGQELYLYVREKGHIIGGEEEWILSPRLDDQLCVYSILEGIVSAEAHDYIPMAAVFHNEEVGSGSRQGADSTFLSDVLCWIGEAMGETQAEYRRNIVNSFLVSADNAHAVHPNYPEKADVTNKPVLNGGIVLKFHGGQKYTTDAVSAGYLRMLCKEAQIPCQSYYNHSDIVGGSTLGNISGSHVSVPSGDIGIAQLAMHSAMETAGAKDVAHMTKFMHHYFCQ